MIYEVRTYELMTGNVVEYERKEGEALPAREKYSELTAWWHTEVGILNQEVHMWAYEDLGQMARIKAQYMSDPIWAPPGDHFHQHEKHMMSEIMTPAPFMRPIEPGHHGNIYEMRIYTCKPGSMSEIMKRWGEMMPRREKYSPCLACGFTELGGLNRLIHIWPYESMEERGKIRKAAVDNGDWPPKTREFILKMENKILIPAPFSPVN